MRSRSVIGLAAACTVLAACGGLKDALTAHVDVVARAGSQELSVNRLGDLLGDAKIAVPVTRENAAIVTDLWTGYQQLAYAAAHGDSLHDPKLIDAAVAPIINMEKLQIFMDSVSKSFKVDTASEAAYNQAVGGLLGARHILIGFKNPGVPPSTAEKDSARTKAMEVRAQVTPANFDAMAKKYSTEPGAAQSGGNLHVFAGNVMIPAFSKAVMALKPGEISQPVETNFGYHIIQRLTYADAAKDFATQYSQAAAHIADSTYMAQIESSANVQVRDNAAESIKNAAKDPSKHRNDKATLATYNGGSLTLASFLGWIETTPPQQQIMQRIPQAPDSVLTPFIKQIATQQVLLAHADSAKITVPPKEQADMYAQIGQLVTSTWQTLGVDPKQLADSAQNTAEKERLAASRVDAFLNRVMAGQAQPVSLPTPLKRMLDSKYESTVNAAGIDRAVELASKVRATADSTKSANQPKTQIPLPMGGAGGNGVGAPPAESATPPKPPTQ